MRSIPQCRRTGALGRASSGRSGNGLVAALFWLFAIVLFAVPLVHDRQVTNWKAQDHNRKTAYWSDEDESSLDLPFLEDLAEFVAVAREEGWDLGDGDFEVLVADSSRRVYGREFRDYFAADAESYQREFVDSMEPSKVRAVDSAPIDLDAARATGLFKVERLVPGEHAYLRQCAGCHGLAGDGSGPAATFLSPRPRNFRRGKFKFTSTKSGSRPLREDLYRTITDGMVGSAMPRFFLLPEEKRWDIVEYVRYLAIQGEFEQTMLDLAWTDEAAPDPDEVVGIVASRWGGLNEEYPASTEPANDEASVQRGREIFTSDQNTCAQCHGDTGRGDGVTSDAYNDQWGYPLKPRDFTKGALRVGLEGKDLWVVIAHGLDGTPMPGALSGMSSEDVWHLVHYVQFMATGGGSEEK